MKKSIFFYSFSILLFLISCGTQKPSQDPPEEIRILKDSIKTLFRPFTDILDMSSNHFIIINKTNFKIKEIFLEGIDQEGHADNESITSKSNHDITSVKRYGISYHRTKSFDIKSVTIIIVDPDDQSKEIPYKFPKMTTQESGGYKIAQSKNLTIPKSILQDGNKINGYVRQIFVQKNDADENSYIVLGIEISDKADFNTLE